MQVRERPSRKLWMHGTKQTISIKSLVCDMLCNHNTFLHTDFVFKIQQDNFGMFKY